MGFFQQEGAVCPRKHASARPLLSLQTLQLPPQSPLTHHYCCCPAFLPVFRSGESRSLPLCPHRSKVEWELLPFFPGTQRNRQIPRAVATCSPSHPGPFSPALGFPSRHGGWSILPSASVHGPYPPARRGTRAVSQPLGWLWLGGFARAEGRQGLFFRQAVPREPTRWSWAPHYPSACP